MDNKKKNITRRDFMRGTAGAAMLTAAGAVPGTAEKVAKANIRTKVVLVRNAKILKEDGSISAPVMQEMLDQGVTTLLGVDDPVQAWKKLVKPTDVVGIKSNEWGRLPTPSELEQAIKKRVMNAGVDEKKIAIDDRGVLRNPVFKKATALINSRPMRTHAWSGVGSCLKNYIMFDPEPWKYHPNACASLATLWDLPIVKNKTKLNVLVLLTPLFYGIGRHHFDRTYVWPYKGILVGTDPVAVDAVGLHIFKAKRRLYFGEDKPFTPLPRHIEIADTKYHLGVSDLEKIELVKVGWMKDVLI